MPFKIYTLPDGKKEIYDPIRRKRVALTPEEGVRQSIIAYFIHTLQVPPMAIAVEKKINYNGLTRRYDLVVLHKDRYIAVVECKAPTVNISDNTLLQASVYNSILHAPYIILTNGHNLMIFEKKGTTYSPCKQLPQYTVMIRHE